MKTLDIHSSEPAIHHVAIAQLSGDNTLEIAPPPEFYAGCPEVPGFDRAEPGCLLAMEGNVPPHTDTWLGDWDRCPRMQRSFFWLLKGEVTFKVDGAAHRPMLAGNWVVFDHRREHMVLGEAEWLGVAWQLRPAGQTPKVHGGKVNATRQENRRGSS